MSHEYDWIPNKQLKYEAEDNEDLFLQYMEDEIDYSDDSSDEIFIKSELQAEVKIEPEDEWVPNLTNESKPSTSFDNEVKFKFDDPESIWTLLFNDEILQIILHCTNLRFAKQRVKYKRLALSELRDLDSVELRSFIGLLLLTSIFKSNHDDLRWIFATDGTGRDIFRCTTSGNRFATILANLRFEDPSTRLGRSTIDPLAPISEVSNLFFKNCQKVYAIEKSARVDEVFISSRYLSIDILKIITLTDERTGYFFNGDIYTGKDSDECDSSEEENKLPRATQSILRLTRPIFGSNLLINVDDRFVSRELVNLLRSKQLSCAKMPDSGDSDKSPKKRISVMNNIDKDCDKSEPSSSYNDLLSTFHAYSTSRKTKRWPMAVFFKILDICSFNSYILSQRCHESTKVTRYEFIKQLGMQLVSSELKKRFENVHLGREIRNCIGKILKIKEKSSTDDAEEKLTIRKTCKRCPSQKNRKTAYFCIMCKIPVCLECTRKICKDCAI